MNFYLDTEFNGGALISMALVPDFGAPLYEVLECYSPSEWVAANVMPHLGKGPIGRTDLKKKLGAFLRQHSDITIVADYPVDFVHLMQCLELGPGVVSDIPNLTLELVLTLETGPHHIGVKHNALNDAYALRRAYNHERV